MYPYITCDYLLFRHTLQSMSAYTRVPNASAMKRGSNSRCSTKKWRNTGCCAANSDGASGFCANSGTRDVPQSFCLGTAPKDGYFSEYWPQRSMPAMLACGISLVFGFSASESLSAEQDHSVARVHIGLASVVKVLHASVSFRVNASMQSPKPCTCRLTSQNSLTESRGACASRLRSSNTCSPSRRKGAENSNSAHLNRCCSNMSRLAGALVGPCEAMPTITRKHASRKHTRARVDVGTTVVAKSAALASMDSGST